MSFRFVVDRCPPHPNPLPKEREHGRRAQSEEASIAVNAGCGSPCPWGAGWGERTQRTIRADTEKPFPNMRNFVRLGATVATISLNLAGGLCLEVYSAAAKGRAALPAKVNRVLFLGDSITYAGNYVSAVEAYFLTRYPGRSLQFIN